MSYHSNPVHHSQAPPKKLQIVLVNAILNNKAYLLEVSYWITISELKSKIEKGFGIPVAQQRLFFQTQELNQNNFSMHSFGGKKRIKIILRPTPTLENTLGLVKKYETLPTQENLESMLFSVQEGFNLGLIPKLTFDGTSGSYFLQNKYRKNVAIFKPFDEEPFAPNNPKGYIGKLGNTGFKAGIVSGESAIREVVAYLLDEKGFSAVPPTTFVEVVHPYFSRRDMKEMEIDASTGNVPIQNVTQHVGDKKFIIKHGSIQKFVEGAEEASDFGPKLFPDEEVRKIAILDLRILNCDRNEGNILVRKEKGGLHLIPIDHGLCFPDCFQACTYDLVWMEWPQAKKKWTPTELDYISRINPKADVERLTKHFKFRDICLRNFRIAETTLKKGALAGLTLFEIGALLYRDDPDFPSPIEEIIKKTEELYLSMRNSSSNEVFPAYGKLTTLKKRGLLHEEEKENGDFKKKAVCDVLPPARSRAYSESINLNTDGHTAMNTNTNTTFQALLAQTKADSNDLFTIPEVIQKPKNEGNSSHKHLGMVNSNTKASFISKGSSKGESEGFSSEDEEEHEEVIHTGRQDRKMRRSSSIPAALNRIDNESVHEMDETDDSEKKSSLLKGQKKNRAFNRLKKKKVDCPAHKDEIFFKYFESFLGQKIEIMMKNKQSHPARSRFYSDM